MKELIYQSIAYRLLSVVKSIMVYNGLPEDENKTITDYPAIYVEFADIKYNRVSENEREASYVLNLHIVFQSLQDSAIRKDTDVSKRLTAENQILTQTKQLLSGWKPETADSEMELESEMQDTEHSALSVWVQQWTFIATECINKL